MPRHGQYPDALEDMHTRAGQEQPDRGPAQERGTVPGSQVPQSGQRVQLPPFNYPPPGAHIVHTMDDANIAPAASADVVTFNVEPGSSLRFSAIGFGADDEVALRFLTWSILVRSLPLDAYSNLAATVGTIIHPAPIVAHAPGPASVIVRLVVDAAAAATYRYVVTVQGWFYSEDNVT